MQNKWLLRFERGPHTIYKPDERPIAQTESYLMAQEMVTETFGAFCDQRTRLDGAIEFFAPVPATDVTVATLFPDTYDFTLKRVIEKARTTMEIKTTQVIDADAHGYEEGYEDGHAAGFDAGMAKAQEEDGADARKLDGQELYRLALEYGEARGNYYSALSAFSAGVSPAKIGYFERRMNAARIKMEEQLFVATGYRASDSKTVVDPRDHQDPYGRGQECRVAGGAISQCPFPSASEKAHIWKMGWKEAKV